MDHLKHRARGIYVGLPPGQRVAIIAALGALVIVAAAFVRWVSAPSYALLASDLDDKSLSRVIGQLDSSGVPYRIDGGSRVLVPREQVYKVRAQLAEAGVANRTTPAGYEILDSQGLAVSDFKQRVDFRRAIEGELAKTLMEMNGVDGATVHLALPDERPFEENADPVTASVLLDASRQLTQAQVETIVFLVSSAVDGLEPAGVTVADATGRVLAAPGDVGGDGAAGNRNMRITRDYEAAIASDITRLLAGITPGPAPSVVVRAQLNFDTRSVERETYDQGSAVPLSEKTVTETLTGGSGTTAAAGIPGASGIGTGTAGGGPVNYEKQDSSTEWGVNKQVVRTSESPGKLERLSVAIVMDDGSRTKVTVPPAAELEDLVSKAVGLDASRGDTVKVTQVALEPKTAAAKAQPLGGIVDVLPRAAGALVFLLAALMLFLQVMKARKARPITIPMSPAERLAATEALHEMPVAGALPADDVPAYTGPHPRDVREMVERQPEEIAGMLRTWLSDRRR